jgi:hypothetical protein
MSMSNRVDFLDNLWSPIALKGFEATDNTFHIGLDAGAKSLFGKVTGSIGPNGKRVDFDLPVNIAKLSRDALL